MSFINVGGLSLFMFCLVYRVNLLIFEIIGSFFNGEIGRRRIKVNFFVDRKWVRLLECVLVILIF